MTDKERYRLQPEYHWPHYRTRLAHRIDQVIFLIATLPAPLWTIPISVTLDMPVF